MRMYFSYCFIAALIFFIFFPQGWAATSPCAERIVWSKQSIDKALVYRSHGDKVDILVCSLQVVERRGEDGELHTKRTFATCEPIEPLYKDYLRSDLEEDWKYLTRREVKERLGGSGLDMLQGFFVTVAGVRVGQYIAKGVGWVSGKATTGIKAVAGEGGEKAASCAFRFAGLGESLIEGSKIVGDDRFLRFFPAYIGTGAGITWAAVNEIRFGEFRRAIRNANTLHPNRLGDSSVEKGCEPVELKGGSVEELLDQLKRALNMAQDRPNSRRRRDEHARRQAIPEKIKKTYDVAPLGTK